MLGTENVLRFWNNANAETPPLVSESQNLNKNTVQMLSVCHHTSDFLLLMFLFFVFFLSLCTVAILYGKLPLRSSYCPAIQRVLKAPR